MIWLLNWWRSLWRLRVHEGLLYGPGVTRLIAHPSWHYRGWGTAGGVPIAIMAHYTATNPGTAAVMHERRVGRRGADDRAASWHFTIAHDGRIWQQVPLTGGAWHCGRGQVLDGRHKVRINRAAIGIELEGHGREFPPAQVEAAKRLWRCLVQEYGIAERLAMLQHSEFDPARRRDPGPVWMGQYAPTVLNAAFAVG